MAKAAVKKRTNRRSFLLMLGLILLVGYFIISILGYRIQLHERTAVLEQKKASYQSQVEENERLEAILANEDKSGYMEQVAREKLGYVMPGEKVFYDVTPGA